MYKKIIEPRIGETDGMRHINNTALPVWFELARNPIFRIFDPDLELTYKKWKLIMVRSDFNYLRQIYYGYDVEIRTYVTKIGNTSLTVYHEAWQKGKLRANGSTVMIYYDFIKQESMSLTDDIRKELEKHYITKEELEKKNKKEEKESSAEDTSSNEEE